MAKENSDWGYDRIVGAMANLGYRLSDQTVGNILQRHGTPEGVKILMRPCASPHAPVAGHCGARIRLDVRYHLGRKHLPIVDLRRAA